MAKVELILKNPGTEKLRTAPLGFSWTMLLFGFFVPFIRRDWKGGFVILVFDIITLGIASVFFAFFYNRWYARRLLHNGYKVFHIRGQLSPRILNSLLS